MPRFSSNEYHQHQGCSTMQPMNFPPVHFYSSVCVACTVETFRENGEFARWVFTIQELTGQGYSFQGSDTLFYLMWLNDLRRGAFDEETPILSERRLRAQEV